MDIKILEGDFSVSDQVTAADIQALHEQGVKLLICNRPDGEAESQPPSSELASAAQAAGMSFVYLPVVHDTINSANAREFALAIKDGGRIHGFCRSGLRTTTLWALSQIKQGVSVEAVKATVTRSGFDFRSFDTKFAGPIAELTDAFASFPIKQHAHILIIGGGAGGISLASSMLMRDPNLEITIVDPASEHYYQPGFTMVGGGIFKLEDTRRKMGSVMPHQVNWIKLAATHFLPEQNQVVLSDNSRISYDRLCVSAGIKLNWDAVEGLSDTLGKNGVTSNYRPDLSSYTWQLVNSLKKGTALFTQPPMPIKCAGAPQKALYLSASHWESEGHLKNINVHFYNAGGVLFGVKDYMPALESYVSRYNAALHFSHNLIKVDGPARTATFATTDADGKPVKIEAKFDMLHVCPAQCAPDFVRNSPLADRAGWIDVDQETLRHKRYPNIWGLGDVTNTPNAKTAAAVRKQAPIVAANMLADIQHKGDIWAYDGYGSCPLTVENGKVVLAEFGYGGKLQPTFPTWLLDGRKPTRLGWFIKKTLLPVLYWRFMLKGKELMCSPEHKVSK